MNKHDFTVPFVCGARDLGEGLRRIAEGAAMIRTKGEAGTGDVSEAVRHARTIRKQIKIAQTMDSTELYGYAKELRVPVDLLKKTAELGRLPVVNFAAGGLGIYFYYYTSVNTEMWCPKGKCGCQYFILLTPKKKSWTQGSWIFLNKKLILDFIFA